MYIFSKLHNLTKKLTINNMIKNNFFGTLINFEDFGMQIFNQQLLSYIIMSLF